MNGGEAGSLWHSQELTASAASKDKQLSGAKLDARREAPNPDLMAHLTADVAPENGRW